MSLKKWIGISSLLVLACVAFVLVSTAGVPDAAADAATAVVGPEAVASTWTGFVGSSLVPNDAQIRCGRPGDDCFLVGNDGCCSGACELLNENPPRAICH